MTIECISLQPKTASANIEKTLDSLTEKNEEKRGKNPLTHSIFLRALFSLFVSRADRLLLLSMLVRTCVYTAKEASERERAKFEDIYDFFSSVTLYNSQTNTLKSGHVFVVISPKSCV